jgi:thioredoxin reductase
MEGYPKIFDALVFGAGPAGLSAAYTLGRCQRSAIVFESRVVREPVDDTPPPTHVMTTRNRRTPAARAPRPIHRLSGSHNGAVLLANSGVVSAARLENETFSLVDDQDRTWVGKKVILAAGRRDSFPRIEGYAGAWSQTM